MTENIRSTEDVRSQHTPYLKPVHAWAYSLGTTIGWGSLVITCSSYLSQAGTAGSILGLAIGAAAMLLIAANYHYMMNCFPEAGGAYTYAREVFGFDQGFLMAWFVALTYFAVLWANATSLPLFARYFLGDMFHVGYMYTVFGYDVYVGEVLLTAAGIALIGILSVRSRRLTALLVTGMALLLTVGIAVCFVSSLPGHANYANPAFVPDKNSLSQVIRVACISPWAFIGFENISHATEEFAFPRQKAFRILAAAVLTGTALYVCIMLLSVSAYPPEYPDWLSYIRDSGNLPGLKGLPAFYAANRYMGQAGVSVLMVSLLCLILTSLIGNSFALSRLLMSLARDRVIPKRFSLLNRHGVPVNAMLLISGVSMLIPLIGRTAIGWIVDVTTVGATLIYGFVSAAAWKLARVRGDRREQRTGMAGLVLMIGIGLYLLVPDLFTAGTIETESWFLFVVWSLLGFFFFRVILQRDENKRFGHTIIVWIALLSLVLFVSLVWMSKSEMNAARLALERVQEYYHTGVPAMEEDAFMQEQLRLMRTANGGGILVVIGLFAVSLGVLLNSYSVMSRKARESEAELGQVRTMANTDPLTGVKSKHAYAEKEAQLNAEIEEKTRQPFALAVCDVNGLKLVNDTRGHKAGDEYIRAASRLICEVFQHSPVYRIGGDEFLVILEGRDLENSASLIEQANQKVEDNIRRKDVSVAIGMAAYVPESDATMHAVFERADAVMYRRKKELKSMGAPVR